VERNHIFLFAEERNFVSRVSSVIVVIRPPIYYYYYSLVRNCQVMHLVPKCRCLIEEWYNFWLTAFNICISLMTHHISDSLELVWCEYLKTHPSLSTITYCWWWQVDLNRFSRPNWIDLHPQIKIIILDSVQSTISNKPSADIDSKLNYNLFLFLLLFWQFLSFVCIFQVPLRTITKLQLYIHNQYELSHISSTWHFYSSRYHT